MNDDVAKLILIVGERILLFITDLALGLKAFLTVLVEIQIERNITKTTDLGGHVLGLIRYKSLNMK